MQTSTDYKFLRLLIKEMINEAAKEDLPARFTPQSIMLWKSKKIVSSALPGSGFEEPTFLLSNYQISNFYPADNENETILQFHNPPAPVDEILKLGCAPIPLKYVTNNNSMFMTTLKNKFNSDEAIIRYTEIIKNVKDNASLSQSRPYNSSQTYFVITSSTNPNFKVIGGKEGNVIGDSLTGLYKNMIADPLKGYGIWLTTMPATVQKETIDILTAAQTSLSILTVVPGFNKVAAVANLGPSLALASYYAAIHEKIDPDAKVKIPIINAEVEAKTLNAVNVGGNLLAGILGCFAGVQQFISEINTLQRLRTLSGLTKFVSGGSVSITTLEDLRQAYVALGSNFRLAASFTDSLGTTVTTSTAGWQAVEGGFVYVTGTGNNWLNNVTKIGIIADVAGDAVVFTQQEVNLINSLLQGRNYFIIGHQLQAAINGTSSVWLKISAGIDILGLVLDVWTLQQIIDAIPEKVYIEREEITPEQVETSVRTIFSRLSLEYQRDIAGGNWGKLLSTTPGRVNVMDISTKSIKTVPSIVFDSSLNNYLNSQTKSFIPKLILVSSDLYSVFESVSKLKSSLGKNYSWKANDAGEVFLVLSRDFVAKTI